MELKCINYTDTKEIWSQSKIGTKFEQNGKYGFKDSNGKVLLEPIFDQIEQCKEYLYTRAGEIMEEVNEQGFFVVTDSGNDSECLCKVLNYHNDPSLYRGALQSDVY